tara:strand:+ start:131 stop:667 length:537 start_codon:yes stop_codon:yes gene_type:complete
MEDKKVILVGPSKTLLKDKLGKKIDSFDIVCRMNSSGRPDVVTEENKHIIGTKKDIWLCKHIGLLNLFPVNGYNKIVKLSNDNNKVNEYVEKLKKFNNFNSRPSCGILSIFYLLEKFKNIYICGMDGFKGGHFYGNKFISNQEESDVMASNGIGAHDILKELDYIEYLINKNKIKILI